MRQLSVHVWDPAGHVRRLSPDRPGAWFQANVDLEGRFAVFWGGTSGRPRLWRAGLEEPSAEPFTASDLGARHPALHPGGDRVVFCSDRNAQEPDVVESIFGTDSTGLSAHGEPLHLYDCGSDGGDVRQLTDGPHRDERPAIDSHGRVAFVSDRSGSRGLWLLEGSEPRLVVEAPLYRPAFSVDGASLFAYEVVDPGCRIVRIDLATGGWHRLGNDPQARCVHGPVADPDGLGVLAHAIDHDGSAHIHRIPLDGAPAGRLDPPGFEARAAHATRARTGQIVFDA